MTGDPGSDAAGGGQTDASPGVLPVLARFGEYDVLARLALGGMAELLLARRRDDGREVVIKRLLPALRQDTAAREMFRSEAEIGLRLRHPHIARVHRRGCVGDVDFVEVELIRGVSLRSLLERVGPGALPLRIACTIALRLSEALHAAHELRDEEGNPLEIVHRDVGPENVMLSHDGEVKLVDFGIARGTFQRHETSVGVLKGKFAYMAPEQFLRGEIDRRADIYALGVTLFEMLTGVSPFARASEVAAMEAVVEGPVPTLASHQTDPDPALASLLERALAKAPSKRPATAEDMAAELRAILAPTGPAPAGEVKALLAGHFGEDPASWGRVQSTPFGTSYHETSTPESRPSGMPRGALRSHRERGAAAARPIPPTSSEEDRARAAQPALGRPTLMVLASLVVVVAVAFAYGAWAPRPKPVIPVAPAATSTASLHIVSVPVGAQVWRDGNEVGSTPLALSELPAGEHVLRVAREGYLPFEARVEVAAGTVETVTARLRPAPVARSPAARDGRLTLDTVPQTRVYLEDELLGETPLESVPVASGAQVIELRTAEGERRRAQIWIEGAGDETRVFLDWSQLPR